MSVYIIAADDAKALANKLRTSLQSTAQHIETIPVAGFLKLKSTRKEKSVNVIFLTTLTWQEIQRQRGDVKRLFSKSMDTVVLSSCAESVTSAAVEMFSKKVVDWESVRLFEASGEEWYKAEARIKYRLSELESGEFHIPCASRYIFKPDSVSTLSESKSEVLIILFDDGTAEYPTDVKKVEVKTAGENLIEAKKIQSNVWSFSALDLAPGDHEVRVLVDSIDIGTNILHVQNQHLIVRELLANFKREDPEGFLAELLRVNKEDFDHDLLDTIGGSSRVSLVETLLKYGDENGYEYPNFLHFCAKYGYKACVDWCQKLPDFKEACMVQNRHGKTPEQVATEAQQNQSLIQTLQTNDAGDEGEYLPTIGSPFKPGRDSGWSSQGSSNSSMTIPEHSASTGNSPRYQISRKPRPYNTIGDEDDKNDPYNRPWEGRTMLANRSAQALSAGTLSGSVREGEKEKKKGLSRSNTAGSRGTKL